MRLEASEPLRSLSRRRLALAPGHGHRSPKRLGRCALPLAPIIEGHIGCVVIRPDGSRYLARVMPDPLAQQQPE